MSNSTEIQVSSQPTFNFGEHAVRVVVRDGEPWFVASDVCGALLYKNTSDAVATHLDDDERSTIANSESRNGGGSLVVISESGLYALVLRSRKPEARKFAKWVTSEVLPSIRKTGKFDVRTNVGPLTKEMRETIKSLVIERAKALPHEKQAGAIIKVWSSLKSHFGVSYKEIASDKYTEALSLVARMQVEWELVDDAPTPKKYHFPLEAADPHDRWLQNAWMTPRALMDPKNRALELELLEQLERDGHDVAGVKVRILAMRQNMAQVEQVKDDMRRVRERLGPIMEIINVGLAERGLNVKFAGAVPKSQPSTAIGA